MRSARLHLATSGVVESRYWLAAFGAKTVLILHNLRYPSSGPLSERLSLASAIAVSGRYQRTDELNTKIVLVTSLLFNVGVSL